MPLRKMPLVENNYYHIYSRSIAKYVVFNNTEEYTRFINIVNLCRHENFNYKYSKFLELNHIIQQTIANNLANENSVLVGIVAYCLMPTHIHFILKQVKKDGIAKFMLRVMSSYSRYFNQKHRRSGPLWSGRFKNVIVVEDEQLIHLTRYIHLNPTSAGLVKKPKEWNFSSLSEYITTDNLEKLCNFKEIIDMTPKQYEKFVNNQRSYQRDLSKIKNTMIDNYSG